MNNELHLSRRTFLATSAAAVATATAGARISHSHDHLHVGLLGPGQNGSALLEEMETIGPEYRAGIVATHRDSLDAIKSAGVDGVIVATPDHLHAETAIAALGIGLHVFCAAPMALTEQEAGAVRAAARASDRVYQLRVDSVFEPRWRAARALVQSGVIGDVRWCSGSTYESAADRGSRDWKLDPRCTHGPAALHLHELWAACAYVTGAQKPIAVTSMGGGHRTETVLPDALSLSADFEHDVHFNLDCNPARHIAPHAVIRGSAGSLIIERECIAATPESIGGADVREVWRTDGSPSPTALQEWLTCIRTHRACTVDADLAYNASAGIVLAMNAYRTNAAA